MKDIILSICIPTFYRASILRKTLDHLIQIANNEIEIVISDNGSPDNTKEIVKSFNDPRIKYFRNKENLGVDINIIKCVEHATGKFIFFLSDEDIVEIKTIPWIIDKIKNDPSITQILGSIIDIREDKKIIYFNPGDCYLKAGYDSLTNIFFATSYFSGLTLKRSSLNLKQAKKFIGYNYMHQVLLSQNLTKGNTLCTSQIFCYINKPSKKIKSHIFSEKSAYIKAGFPYDHPLNRISFIEQTILLIRENMADYPKAQKKLLIKK